MDIHRAMKTTMFTDKTGKKSSKRILGFTGFSVALAMFMVSGLHWYEIPQEGILGVMGICAGMMSIGGLTKEG